MKNTVPAIVAAKNEAENLRKILSEFGVEIKSTQALQKLSKIKNYSNWETYRAVLEKQNSSSISSGANSLQKIPSYAFKHTYTNTNSEFSPIVDGFEPVNIIANKGVIKISQEVYNGEKMVERVVSITNPTDARKVSQDYLNWAIAEEGRLKDLISGKTNDIELVTIHKEANDFFTTRLGERFWCGRVCLYFEELGEGYHGKYNSNDPNDRSLLRLNFALYRDAGFVELETKSVLTRIVASEASKYTRHNILKKAMEWYVPIAHNLTRMLERYSKEFILENLSQIDQNWDYKFYNSHLDRRSAALAPQFGVIDDKNWGKFSGVKPQQSPISSKNQHK